VLSIGKMAPGQGQYYIEQVARGAEDYYVHAGEAPGRWGGAGSSSLTLQGVVEDSDFTRVLAGCDPRSGEYLGRQWAASKVPGFDLTFSAPKSVSLLGVLGGPEVQGRVRVAHDRAVDAALAHLERVASQGRRGKGGTVRIETSGFVAAMFRHRSSRAGDPQMHTHCVVANKVRGLDGRWSSLDGAELYRHARSTGTLYQAHLRHELRDLGLRWELAENGTAELSGVPRSLLRTFSQRRIEVEQRMADLGLTSARGAQIATLDTRHAKDYAVSAETLLEQWHGIAERARFGPAVVEQLVESGRSTARCSQDEDMKSAVTGLAAPSGLTARTSTFDEREVLRLLAATLPSGAAVEEIEHAARDFVDRSPDVVAVGSAGAEVVGGVGVSLQRYTTTELLTTEQALVESAQQRQRSIYGLAPSVVVEQALADPALPELAGEQEAMVRRLCTGGDGVAVVNALAGSGKTTSLAVATKAWEQNGAPVVGVCLSAKAAGVLGEATGMRTSTVARLLHELDAHGGVGLRDRTVLVVDEAGQVGTRALARLEREVAAVDGKLVLVGDVQQLPEIDAGGAYRSLARRLPTIELTTNRRQLDSDDRTRLAELRSGDVAAAVRAYDAAGFLQRSPGEDKVREQLVSAWLVARHADPAKSYVMLGMTNAEVDDLNRRARVQLEQSGTLSGPALVAGDRAFQRGDMVVTRRNDYPLGLRNGDAWAVTAASEKSVTLLRQDERGVTSQVVEVPRWYVEAGHLQHGYAITVAVAQGSTYDRSFILGSEAVYREAGYVAASRARESSAFYVSEEVADRDADCVREPPMREGEQRWVEQLSRTRGESLALDLD